MYRWTLVILTMFPPSPFISVIQLQRHTGDDTGDARCQRPRCNGQMEHARGSPKLRELTHEHQDLRASAAPACFPLSRCSTACGRYVSNEQGRHRHSCCRSANADLSSSVFTRNPSSAFRQLPLASSAHIRGSLYHTRGSSYLSSTYGIETSPSSDSAGAASSPPTIGARGAEAAAAALA